MRISVYNLDGPGKRIFGMDKFRSVVDKVHLELGGKLHNFENQDPIP
jgi:hypothetical protein